MMTRFLSETTESRGTWNYIFKMCIGKKIKKKLFKILYSDKRFFKTEGEFNDIFR